MVKIGSVWYICVKNNSLKYLSFNDHLFYTLCDIYDNSADEYNSWQAFHYMSKLSFNECLPYYLPQNTPVLYDTRCLYDKDFVFKLYEWLYKFTFYGYDFNFTMEIDAPQYNMLPINLWKKQFRLLLQNLYYHHKAL